MITFFSGPTFRSPRTMSGSTTSLWEKTYSARWWVVSAKKLAWAKTTPTIRYVQPPFLYCLLTVLKIGTSWPSPDIAMPPDWPAIASRLLHSGQKWLQSSTERTHLRLGAIKLLSVQLHLIGRLFTQLMSLHGWSFRVSLTILTKPWKPHRKKTWRISSDLSRPQLPTRCRLTLLALLFKTARSTSTLHELKIL